MTRAERDATHIEQLKAGASVSVPSQTYSVALGGSGIVAEVTLPVPLMKEDIQSLRDWCAYMDGIVSDDDAQRAGERSKP